MDQNQPVPQVADTATPSSPEKKSVGPMIGIIVIILILIAGALYFFMGGEGVSTSTDVNTIESELNETDTEGQEIDNELNQIEAELDAEAAAQ